MRILVVADGLEPLLHHSVVGLAERGHHVRVVGAASAGQLDPVDAFRLSGSLRVSADRAVGRTAAQAVRTATDLVGAMAHNRVGLAAVTGALRRRLGVGPEFRRRMAQMLPALAAQSDVVYFEAAYVAVEFAWVLDHLPATLIMCTGSDVRILPEVDPNIRRGLPEVFDRAASVVCRSADLREWAIRRGAPAGRTTVLYPGVDLGIFSPTPLPPRRDGVMRMVSVGRLHWVKGYEYAVHATHLAQQRGHKVAYSIVGANRGNRQPIDIAIRDFGLEDTVRLVGPRSVAGVRATLARSDVFVVSSVSEGVSRAAQEAMAMGLPVITTDAGGMSELVTDGVDGYIVPARDQTALAEAMAALAADPARRTSMGERARVRAQEFDAVRHLDALEALLVDCAGSV